MQQESTTVPPIGQPTEVYPSHELLEATRRGEVIWRAIPGTDGSYEVSNFGQIRSWRRNGTGQIIKQTPNRDGGYLCVGMRIGISGRRTATVNVLMCEAFIGPRPGSSRIWDSGHTDDVKENNVLTNVKWCTRKSNVVEKIKNGRTNRRECRMIEGVKHYCCTICMDWKPEESFKPISNKSTHCGRHSACAPCDRERSNAYKRKSRSAQATH